MLFDNGLHLPGNEEALSKIEFLSKRRGVWMGLALVLWVLICYGFALRLPFFFDDLPVLAWVRRHDWSDIWTSQENGYYRPLTFTVYKLGMALPVGAQQVVLHAVNLVLHWLDAALIFQIVRLCDRRWRQAALAAVLFVVFPFFTDAVPWVTTLPHFLATFMTLFATYAALRAEREQYWGYWAFALVAMVLAPLAHESGAVCAVIVGGVVLIQHGLHLHWRLGWITLGGLLNVGVVLGRSFLPRAKSVLQLAGLQDLFQNSMFFVQGLLYPIAPGIAWLARRWAWHDFALLGIVLIGVALLLIVTVSRSHDWRWAVRALWWWGWGALPAALSLRYNRLFISPRLYALASVGSVLLWSRLLVEIGALMPWKSGRRMFVGLIGFLLLVQNVTYLRHEQRLYTLLDGAYQTLLSAATEANAPLGVVNLPSALEWEEKTYPLVKDAVVFIPNDYAKVEHFLELNREQVPVNIVAFAPVAQEVDPVWLSQGSWLDWDEMYQFACDNRTIWLCRYDERDQRFTLDYVGEIFSEDATTTEALAYFEGGPFLTAVSVSQAAKQRWTIALDWLSQGPIEATVFVHIVDRAGNLVAQADGMALGGMVPLSLWRLGDHLHDVRYVDLPADSAGPYQVRVGLYSEQGRFPAYMQGVRCLDDAVVATTFE